MENRVSHYDEEGFAQVYTILEATVTRTFNKGQSYCFARLRNGASVFVSYHKGSWMSPYAPTGSDYIPRFYNGDLGRGRMPDPQEGDRLVLLTRQETKGPAASVWSYRTEYDRALESCKVFAALDKGEDAKLTKEQASRLPVHRYAGLFDLPVDGPAEEHGVDRSPNAIGGYYGMGWYEYFKDAATGELYKVHCSDGVNGGKLSHSPEDERRRDRCYRELLNRFHDAERARAGQIQISLHERAVIQGLTHAVLLETADRRADGKQSKDGLKGGLMGHYHGIPVFCNINRPDGSWATD